jgi:hypothetical protein
LKEKRLISAWNKTIETAARRLIYLTLECPNDSLLEDRFLCKALKNPYVYEAVMLKISEITASPKPEEINTAYQYLKWLEGQ